MIRQSTRTRARARLARVLALATLTCALGAIAPQLASAVTVSGTAMKDEVGTTWQGCALATANLKVAVNGVAAGTTSCTPGTGAFTFSGVTIPSVGAVVTIWLDNTPGATGVLYTTAASTGGNITGLVLTQDRVTIRSEQVARTVTGTELDTWDSAQDPDVPVTVDGTGVVVPTTTEIHVANATFAPQTHLETGSVHVTSTGTFQPQDWTTTILGAPGTQACTTGPGIARPLCVDPGGTFTAAASELIYDNASGTAAIEPLTYYRLGSGSAGTRELGYADGQVVTVLDNFKLHDGTLSSPYATNVVSDEIEVTGLGRWIGTAAFTITVASFFDGGGTVTLPGADVVLRSTESRNEIGPSYAYNGTNNAWTLHSLEVSNGGYQRHAWGSGATGMTTPYTSAAGANADVVAAIATGWGGTFVVFNQATNGGDWGIIKYDSSGQPDMDWDDGDLNGVDNDGNAVLTFNSGGAQADVAYVADSSGCGVTVAGRANGDWHARSYDCNGMLDTSFFGTGTFTWAGSGATDEIRGMYWSNSSAGPQRLVFVGTEATATPRWAVRAYNTSTWALASNFTWNNGGAGAEARGTCGLYNNNWNTFVVGRTGAAGSRDWAVRRILPDASGWDTIEDESANPSATAWTWNPGGTEDEATSCSVGDEGVVVAGTTGTGANDDIRLRAFDTTSGGRNLSYGTGGTVSINNAGDDNAFAVLTERWSLDSYLAGSDATNGGRAFVTRIDADGKVDTSWGTGGSVTWDATVNEESARALDWSWDVDGGLSGEFLRVGVLHGQNAGDVAVREYDYAGDLQTSVTPGTVRVMAQSPDTTRSIRLTGDLNVARSADAGGTLLDLESHDPRMEVGGVWRVRAPGTASMSSTAPLRVANDINIQGGLQANAGEVRLVDQAYRSVVNVSPSTQFRDLRIEEPEKIVAFEETDPIRVNGTFYVRGSSCSRPANLVSNVGGTPWTLNLSGGGTANVQYAELKDATASPVAATATNSLNSGSNTNWTISGCAGTPLKAPNGLQVDGVYRPRGVATVAPDLSWFNRSGQSIDRGDAEVYTSPATDQLALWRFDGNGTDSSGNGYTLTAANGATYGAAKFSQGGSSDAIDDVFSRADPGAFSMQQFTIDGWLRTTFPGAVNYVDPVYKGNGAGTLINYRLGYDRPLDEFFAEFTVAGNFESITIPKAEVGDGTWHHVAFAVGNGVASLYVDGIVRATRSYSGTIDSNTAWPLELGNQIGGTMDDWRISTRALGPDEILGYYRTGAPHFQKVWDADPADTNGVATGTIGTGVRGSITYGGGAGTLRLDGARYWVRSRFRTTAASTPANTWSNWSEYDWFETGQSMSVSLVDGPLVSVGGALVGQDSVATTSLQVTTTNVHGWNASVTGPSNAWAMSDGLSGAAHQIPLVGSPATPVTWSAGTGGFGLTVLAASGGKDTARWGTGTTVSDFPNLKWASPIASTSMTLHDRPAYDGTTQSLSLGLRANAPLGTDPGAFSSTLLVTVVPNV